MHPTRPDLNALLGSRICHDLISPIGAIGNGLELMSLSGLDAAPEFQLVAESARNASARIRLFRLAFGASDDTQSIGQSEVVSILADAMESGRLQIDWQAEGPVPRSDAKLAFLLILCAELSMPWGGTLTVDRTEGSWAINGRAARLKIDPDLWNHLSGQARWDNITASVIQFPLAAATAAATRRTIQTELGDGRITISF